MSTRVRGIGSVGGSMSLAEWMNFELTLDILADASADIAANPSAYTVLLNKTVNASVNGETLEYEIVDIARYDLASGSRKAGVVLMPRTQLSTAHNMNSSDTSSGGWGSSAMRTYLNGLSRPSQAVQVKVPYVNGTDTTVSYANDYLFIPAYGELFGKYSSGNRSVEGDIFAGATNSNAWRVRNRSGSASYYWLRSVSGSSRFWLVDGDGSANSYYSGASGSGGVVPCFCI